MFSFHGDLESQLTLEFPSRSSPSIRASYRACKRSHYLSHQLKFAFVADRQRTAYHCLGQKQIIGGEIAMSYFRDDLTQIDVSACVGKKNEAHQLVAQVCAEKFLSEQEAPKLAFYSLEILSIMQVTPSLTNGSLVEDRCHSLNEAIVKCSRLYDNAVLLSFADLVSGFSLNLFLPPKGIALYRKGRHGIEFHLIRVFGFYMRQTLRKSQDIRPRFGLPQ